MKIGIPRAGLYYNYGIFWETFLAALGFEVVVSEKTDRRILDQGLKIANSELCLPLKIMYGHVLELKDKVDAILLPQMDAVQWGECKKGTSTYFCPYFVGMADVMKAEFPEIKPLRPKMSFYEGAIEKAPWVVFAKELGVEGERVDVAFEKAKKAFCETLRQALGDTGGGQGDIGKEKKKIAVVGRAYLIQDEFASLELLKKIEAHGFEVVTLESIPYNEMEKNIKKLSWDEQSHWRLTNEEFGAIIHFSEQPDIAGIIFVTPFNCGPDFLIEEIIIDQYRKKKPISLISIDESTGEAGLNTRIEAFVDMIRKERRE